MVEQCFCKAKVVGSNPSAGSMSFCLICGNQRKNRSSKYCSNRCESVDRYNQYVDRWRAGLISGSRGIKAKNISNHLKRYLFEKFQQKCVLCSWNKRNPFSGKTALEIDHINGDSEDNSEENLRLVCPNCHSLSANYKNLNKGRGRFWRKAKYLKEAGS